MSCEKTKKKNILDDSKRCVWSCSCESSIICSLTGPDGISVQRFCHDRPFFLFFLFKTAELTPRSVTSGFHGLYNFTYICVQNNSGVFKEVNELEILIAFISRHAHALGTLHELFQIKSLRKNYISHYFK